MKITITRDDLKHMPDDTGYEVGVGSQVVLADIVEQVMAKPAQRRGTKQKTIGKTYKREAIEDIVFRTSEVIAHNLMREFERLRESMKVMSEEETNLVRKGQGIAAIKMMRKRTDCSLADAHAEMKRIQKDT